jgi:hypothetical protein
MPSLLHIPLRGLSVSTFETFSLKRDGLLGIDGFALRSTTKTGTVISIADSTRALFLLSGRRRSSYVQPVATALFKHLSAASSKMGTPQHPPDQQLSNYFPSSLSNRIRSNASAFAHTQGFLRSYICLIRPGACECLCQILPSRSLSFDQNRCVGLKGNKKRPAQSFKPI